MKRVFRNPFRGRDAWRQELDEELQFHLERRTESLIAQGMSPEAARAEAERRLGNLNRIHEEAHDLARRRAVRHHGGRMLDEVGQNLRFGVRALVRRPMTTVVALMTLALGIGATAAVFSVANAVLWRPYPFAEPDEVVAVYAWGGGGESSFGPAMLDAWRDESQSMAGIAGFGWVNPTLTGIPNPTRLVGWRVTWDYFDVLGTPMRLGRGFEEAEDRFGAPGTVVLSHDLWERLFDSDPGVLGRSVELDGEAVTVVGVASPSLEFSSTMPDVYVPLRLSAEGWANAGGGWITGMGRLAAGVTPATARSELERILESRGLWEAEPGEEVRVQPVQARFTDPARAPLVFLLGAVALVLLIGCANIANLLLAQATRRVREVAVRSALGAGRSRVARQFMTENLLLGAAGAILGVGFAAWMIPVLVRIGPAELPRLQEAGLDLTVVAFAAGLAIVTALLFGLAPTLAAGRTDIRSALGDGSRGSSTRRGGYARSLLVGGEVALSMLLLASAGLLLRSILALGEVDRGFDESVVAVQLALPWGSYPETGDAIETFHLLLDEVRGTPGVTAAALTSRAPFFGNGFGLPVTAAEAPLTDESPNVALRIGTAGMFGTMGMRLVAGEDFQVTDDMAGADGIIVNETLARSLGWSGADAVGRRVVMHGGDFVDDAGAPLRWEVVGVVADAPGNSLREAATPEAYFPTRVIPRAPWSWIGRELVLAVKHDGALETLAPGLRAAVARVDPALPVDDIRTLGDRVADSVALERVITLLVTTLGVLALILSAGGIFGVVAYTVAARRPEIGLRMALGSSARETQRLMVRRAMPPVVAGGLFGMVGAVFIGRVMAPLLFGVAPWDPAALGVAFLLLVSVAALAAWFPARQAARVDPVEVLTSE